MFLSVQPWQLGRHILRFSTAWMKGGLSFLDEAFSNYLLKLPASQFQRVLALTLPPTSDLLPPAPYFLRLLSV